MRNYICINGNQTELTDAQVRELGFTPTKSKLAQTIEEMSDDLQSGELRLGIHDTVNLAGYEFEIIGFDHDRSAEDSDLSTITLMAKTLLAPRRMHGGACEHGWIDTELRAYLNNEFIKTLPQELVAHIEPVRKTTHSYNGVAYETTDKLWIPSESELFGSAIYSDHEDGERYEAFDTSESRVRIDNDGNRDWYWTRSARGGNSSGFAYVSYGGYANDINASGASIRAPLCFAFA